MNCGSALSKERTKVHAQGFSALSVPVMGGASGASQKDRRTLFDEKIFVAKRWILSSQINGVIALRACCDFPIIMGGAEPKILFRSQRPAASNADVCFRRMSLL